MKLIRIKSDLAIPPQRSGLGQVLQKLRFIKNPKKTETNLVACLLREQVLI